MKVDGWMVGWMGNWRLSGPQSNEMKYDKWMEINTHLILLLLLVYLWIDWIT